MKNKIFTNWIVKPVIVLLVTGVFYSIKTNTAKINTININIATIMTSQKHIVDSQDDQKDLILALMGLRGIRIAKEEGIK